MCQCLCVDGDGPKMLSTIKGFLLTSTGQFASGSEHLPSRETSNIHSSLNKYLLSATIRRLLGPGQVASNKVKLVPSFKGLVV